MIKKIIQIVAVIILITVPFQGDIFLSKYSPYFEGNGFGRFFMLTLLNAFLCSMIALPVINKKLPKPLMTAGILLSLCGLVMVNMGGLAFPPDFSPAMLKHPEREHYRYACLIAGAVFFTGAFLVILKDQWNVFPRWNRWVLLVFIPAVAEMFWEFFHHYSYAENLQAWIAKGNNALEFAQHYDNMTIIKCAAIARCCQYATIACLGLILLQRQLLKKWVLLVIGIFCLLGIVSNITIFATSFRLPKSVGFFFIFFIPGPLFILLYWLGIGLLTRSSAIQNKADSNT